MRCFSLTVANLLITRETVVIETPESFATSSIEAVFFGEVFLTRVIYMKTAYPALARKDRIYLTVSPILTGSVSFFMSQADMPLRV